ncbi:MAG: ATP-binding protein [Ekhidna sp.]
MDLNQIKNQILHQNIQAIILDKKGVALSSDDQLIALSPGTSLIKGNEVFLGLSEMVEELAVGEEFRLDCIEVEFHGRHSIYDFLIKRLPDEADEIRYLLLIYDLGNVYRKVINLRQERNETAIYAEKLASAHADLKQAQLQLVANEKMAAIGLLAGGMAHEINNPLNYIFNGVELIKRGINEPTENQKVSEMLSIIETGATRIKKVVSNLKVFDSSGHNEQKLVDIHAEINQTLNLVKHRFKDNAEIILNYVPQNISLKCSPEKINQALFNLLLNSATFTNDVNKPRIEISTIRSENQLSVYIKDNGIGIPDAIQKQIFDPFFTTKKMGTGKGLGLSVAHIIIKEHQGKLTCESVEGQGTTFCIQLPLKA